MGLGIGVHGKGRPALSGQNAERPRGDRLLFSTYIFSKVEGVGRDSDGRGPPEPLDLFFQVAGNTPLLKSPNPTPPPARLAF